MYCTNGNQREQCNFQVDCGSTVNVSITIRDIYKQVTHDDKLAHLKPTFVTLLMFNKSELKPIGQTKIQVKNAKNGQKHKLKFIIVAGQELVPYI